MFKVLHIKVGEPVCIMLDLSIVMEQEKLVERALQSVSLFPLQRNYKDMLNGAAAGKVGKVGTGAPRADAKGPELAQHVEAATAGQETAEGKSPEAMALEQDKASGALNAVLLKSLRAYRVLRVDQVLAFERNGEEFNFQVVGLSAHGQQEELPQPKPPSEASSPAKPEDAGLLYLNVGKRLSCVELERTALRQVGQAASSKSNVKARAAGAAGSGRSGNSGSSRLSAFNTRQSQRPAAGKPKEDSIDLDRVFQERGLDIFYMQSLIDEH